MARKLLSEVDPLVAEILEGKHDAILSHIQHACKARLNRQFRKGAKVRLVGTRNVELDGKVGVVIRVNQKSVAVGVGEYDRQWDTYADGTYNVPPSMLEAVA